MKRVFFIICCTMIAVVAAPPAYVTNDAGEAVAQSSSKRVKLKTCRSRLPSGKIKTWRCKANQPCCVNHTMSIYVCGSPIIGCF